MLDEAHSTDAGEENPEENLAEAVRRRFMPLGGVDDLEEPPPTAIRTPPFFAERFPDTSSPRADFQTS
jgi:hypothetical protein